MSTTGTIQPQGYITKNESYSIHPLPPAQNPTSASCKSSPRTISARFVPPYLDELQWSSLIAHNFGSHTPETHPTLLLSTTHKSNPVSHNAKMTIHHLEMETEREGGKNKPED